MKMKTADYLIKKLHTLGITDIFGLPGDFNFKIVEAIERNEDVNWIGSTNELNAGYAADGYGRLKGYSAIVTTFGVGELSAINAVAGSMAENVPVIKIAGVPKTTDIKNKTLLHHNLDNANYYAFKNAYSNVVEKTAYIDTLNKTKIKDKINNLIDTMVKTKKPVYLALPIDVCEVELEVNEKDFEVKNIESDKRTLNKAVNEILKLIEKAKNPIVVADVLAKRFNAKSAVNDFLRQTKIVSTCFIRGLDVINSDVENYLGCYVGKIANPLAYEKLNSSDCIIMVGAVVSDLNTMNFDFKFNINKTINIQPYYTVINGKKYNNIKLIDVINELKEKTTYKNNETVKRDFIYDSEIQKPENKNLELKYVYPKLNRFIKENDILVTEVGLVPFGSLKMDLKNNITVENQMMWGSIGWATPCALGCCLANPNRRTILITGDGSHQLTAQEIATMLRNNVKPVIFVINNSGYTVERILCDDIHYKYNEISSWNYSMLPKAFKGECFTAQVKTNDGFDKVLAEIEQNKDKMCYIELITDYLDIPELAKAISKHHK